MRRAILATAVLAMLPATCGAYYHFVRYGSATAPFQPMPEKFDLRALPARTVHYYVSEKGPDSLAAGDSLPALISQIRRAADIWNGVSTSELRLAFGGLFTPGRQGGAPRVEISFANLQEMEIPPGVVAVGGPEVTESPVDNAFLPITRSVVYLSNDFSNRPSWDPSVFMTVAHEIGHALGLQHTFTSSMMSVGITRATTAARPLAADDAAGLSSLYPTPGYATRFGSISGRVAMNGGSGVHLASVVALTPTGDAVSALTLPDGTFTIEGLAPADYYVYVHPLPPAADQTLGPGDVVLPIGPDGNPVPASGLFGTLFYPGTRDPHQASTVRVTAGAVSKDVNFSVNGRENLVLYGVRRYTFPGSVAVSSGHLNVGYPLRSFLVSWGYGMVADRAPVPGMNVTVLGGSASVPDGGIKPYIDPNWVEIDFTFSMFVSPGPRHLIFSLNDDIYVLPAGLNLVDKASPTISSVENGTTADGAPVVLVNGTGFSRGSKVLFDGVCARALEVSEAGDRVTVIPPPAPPAHQAHVQVLNADGQLASFIQDLPVYTYPDNGQQAITITPSSVVPGTEAMIEINGVNTAFAERSLSAGFGSGDLLVKRVWVTGPAQIRANVAASPAAQAGFNNLTVASGISLLTLPGALEVKPAAEHPVTLYSDVRNAETGSSYVYPGAIAEIPVANIDASSDIALTLDRISVRIEAIENGYIRVDVPQLPAGPVIARLYRGEAEIAAPVFVTVGAPPPVVQAMFAGEMAVSPESTVKPGASLKILVSNLADAGSTVDPHTVTVTIGGIDHVPSADIKPAEGEGREGWHVIEIVLSGDVKPGIQPLTISTGGRTSRAVNLTIEAPPTTEAARATETPAP